MLLVVDVGNSNIVMGVYQGRNLEGQWRINTDRKKTPDQLHNIILQLLSHQGFNKGDLEAAVVSSVVPSIMDSFELALKNYFALDPIIVGPGIKTGINIKYDNPRQLGTDRLVNAIAAYGIYGGPVMIVDLGTATKFCAVSEKGDYMGGMICPGIKISAEALFHAADNLPRVELVKPAKVLCTNTVSGMQAGIINGYVGLVNHLVRMMKKELGTPNAKVVATGGMASLIANETEEIDEVNERLTLEGLRIIYEKNKK